MGNELVDRRQVDRSNAHYMIEGLARALDLDISLFQNDIEVTHQTHNLRFLFEKRKKQFSGKIIALCVLIILSPIFYIGINEFLRVGFTHSLNILLIFQIFAIVCTIIGLIFYRMVKK